MRREGGGRPLGVVGVAVAANSRGKNINRLENGPSTPRRRSPAFFRPGRRCLSRPYPGRVNPGRVVAVAVAP